MAIPKRKSSSEGNMSEKKQIIKINRYENPENVMELMSRICSAKATADTDVFWDYVNDAFNKEIKGVSLRTFLDERRRDLYNIDFLNELRAEIINISVDLTIRENTKHTQIVVAGGFSSGKSSFLNRLTGSVNLLPTGIEPVSVVKTYLYCSKNAGKVLVRGVNKGNVVVQLGIDVLQAIQHGKESSACLASVLEKLFVEIPSDKLDGLAFIDTPGYNNTEKPNSFSGKSDRDTAMEALGEGQVLFWLIDCERGTTVAADIEMIKSFSGKKVIIFNKAERKGEDCKQIVEEAASVLFKEIGEKDIIDILAYSTYEERIYYSYNGMTLDHIIKFVKKEGNGTNDIVEARKHIEQLFDNEIASSEETIETRKQDYREEQKNRDEWRDIYNTQKSDQANKSLEEVLVKGYNDILNVASRFQDCGLENHNHFGTFLEGVQNFEENDHWGSSNILNRALRQAVIDFYSDDGKYKKLIKNYNSYSEEYRKNLINSVNSDRELLAATLKDYYEEAENNCISIKEGIEKEEKLIEDMKAYKNLLLPALDLGIREYQNQNKDVKIQVDDDDDSAFDVFSSIQKDNYSMFMHSLEDGIDMTLCNAEGYNPLTFAVKEGNIRMLKFLLDNDADPALKDGRGYNAFHTAIENNYKNICKLLLDYGMDFDEDTANGETMSELAEKNKFGNWIKGQIN